MIPSELDITSTPFCDTTILKYEIELPTSVKQIGFNLLDNEYFRIPYVTDIIPNLPADHQLTTHAKKNVWIVSINVEEPITDQGVIGKLNLHQNPHGKSKVKISLCRRKSYHREDLEDICSKFNQVRHVVSHI